MHRHTKHQKNQQHARDLIRQPKFDTRKIQATERTWKKDKISKQSTLRMKQESGRPSGPPRRKNNASEQTPDDPHI